MERFSAPVRAWFEASFAAPTPAQAQGWPAIADGDHSLILAPTGSGKTLAAFLWAIDRLGTEPEPPKDQRCRVLYISPLRALAVDVEKNLRSPLAGITLAAERLGTAFRAPTVGIRTGDTPGRERQQLVRTPPDILITTPESLYLMLTSRARETLRSVRYVIVDEIHALAPTKRGAHLMLSLERLEAIAQQQPPQRIGLSATQRPLDEIARFLGGQTEAGARPVTVVDAGSRKVLDLEVIVPVDDMAEIGPAAGAEPDDAELPQGNNSIWPHVHPRVLELIRAHHTTLVFCNARRLAERLAAHLNELAGEDLVRAHHGSLSREQRLQIEGDLKAGRLRGLVATSSLELGIDMGTVDLVVLVESPGSVARGMQRVGRAGHQVGEPSTGKIFPKYRGDLLESAIVVARMREGLVEEMRYPRNPIDVLAQQIVAACAVDEWAVEDLLALVRRCANFSDLTDDTFVAVLDMLAGRYPSDRFSGLRPRVVWDRLAGRVRAREGAQRVAITNGGTIPDRGLFGVFLPDGVRVGELDEEMVYESRPGETFLLGATTWRIEEITFDRVIVVPAPGEHGKMPFWRGDRPGRPLELGRALGAMVRELRGMSTADAEARLLGEGLDGRAAANLVRYLEEQGEATGAVPDDRTIVVERFPDEIGDWRVCLLTPFGSRVHAPWALAIEERLARLDLPVQVLWSDDGIILRLPEALEDVPLDVLLVDPDEVEDLVVERLPSTSLFASRFRENAARALLLPRRRPGERTPLWQQRQRAADLLEVASGHPSFPILLETTREALRDVFDLPSLREVLTEVRSRRVRVVPVETRRASPFAQSLLFGWIAAYMYEGDAPLAERRAAALALDRDLLRDLLGAEELRELLDPQVLADLELELQRLVPERQARGVDDLHDMLRDLGPLTREEIVARTTMEPTGFIDTLLLTRRAIAVRVAGEDRIAAAEDAARLRDALGTALPPGLPSAFTDPVPAPLVDLVARYARTHGPFAVGEAASRFGVPNDRVQQALAALDRDGRVVLGEFRPGGVEREWCDAGVLRVLRRRSLAALRHEIEPVDATTLARFLPAWHGVQRGRRGIDALVETLEQLQGFAIPASVLERDVLPARVDGYRPAMLDELCAAGELVWIGAGPLGHDDGRVRCYFRDRVRVLAPPPNDAELPEGPLHDSIRERLRTAGASFWPDLVHATGTADEALLLTALWDLVWSGEVTNDTFGPLRAPRRTTKRPSAPRRGRPQVGRLTRLGPPAGAGRWSLVAPLLDPRPEPTAAAHATALQLLERHGVVTRESVRAEGVPGGFAGIYPVFKALEETGRARRGWFVAGMGAAQFASPGAVDRLRAYREANPDDPAVLVLAATDPAQPYGGALGWPDHPGRPARAAGAFVVLHTGNAAAYVERGGRSMLTFDVDASAGPDATAEWIEALVRAHKEGRVPRLALERINDQPARTSPLADALRAAGFVDGYRGLTLKP
ncbi:MAG: putative ATP-dependent helicase [Actinomycetia bacterium]|nr:putative ATP-dependent helicase [Actinomycetes bacterium]